MRSFRPRLLLIVGALTLALGFFAWPATTRPGIWRVPTHSGDGLSLPPLAAIVLAMDIFGVYLSCVALTLCAIIGVDDEGITRRTLFGTRRLLWRRLTRFEVSGTARDEFDLWDDQGRKLSIYAGGMVDGGELKGLIEDRIAPLREALLREWRLYGAKFRPQMPMAPAMLSCFGLLAALCFFGAWALPRVPSHSLGEKALYILGAVLCAVIGLFLTWLIISLATQVILLANTEISVRSLGFERTIPYGEIASIMSREVQTKDTSQFVTTVRSSDGRALAITSQCPNYTCVVEFLQERVGPSSVSEGERDLKTERQKLDRQMQAIAAVATPAIVVLFIIMSVYVYREGQERVDNYRRITREGIATDAVVTGKTTSGSKNTEHLLEYRFQARGVAVPIQGASPVEYEVWYSASPGQHMTALYVPSDPHFCRLSVSISGQLGEHQKHFSFFYLNLMVAVVAWLVYVLRGRYLRRIGKCQDPLIPE